MFASKRLQKYSYTILGVLFSQKLFKRVIIVLAQNIKEGGVRDLSMDDTYRQFQSYMIAAFHEGKLDGIFSEFMDENGSINPRFPFIPLKARDRDLYERVMQDPVVEVFSIFAFFPQLAGYINDPSSISISYKPIGKRGLVAAVKTPDGNFIMKPVQSPDEERLACIIGENGLGPRQFPSIDGYLTEEFLDGTELHALEGLTPESAFNLGQQVAEIYRQLHSLGIIYADWIIQSPDFGGLKSQVIVGEKGPRFIDFGVAVDLLKFPDFSPRDILYICYTCDPMLKYHLGDIDEEELISRLNGVKSELRNAPREETLGRIKECDLRNAQKAFNLVVYAYDRLWGGSKDVFNGFLEGLKSYTPIVN